MFILQLVGFDFTSRCEIWFSADFDVDVLIQFVEPVLEAGDRGEVWGLYIGEVRAWMRALDEAKASKRIAWKPLP
jgi:hypothetical protein